MQSCTRVINNSLTENGSDSEHMHDLNRSDEYLFEVFEFHLCSLSSTMYSFMS